MRRSHGVLENDKLCPYLIQIICISSASCPHAWCCPNQISRYCTRRPKVMGCHRIGSDTKVMNIERRLLYYGLCYIHRDTFSGPLTC